MKVLVIEDDPTVGNFVRRGLEEQRWGVQLVADGEEGERLATSDAYDVVILDMRLPGKSGMDVLNSLRARGFERPVLVLTAQDAVDAKVNALRAGADDYVTKPFAFEELLARVEALARRPRALASPALRVADLELNRDTREVHRSGELIDLTPKEYSVLEYLMRHQGRVMSRTLITEYAWGYHFDPGTNIVDVVINHLRKKVDAKHTKRMITTVPILVLTAQDAVDFKVQALRSGADDYVTKPFAFEELLARVEALGRRPKEIRDPVLRVGDLELDTATREVRRAGTPIELTPKEYTVLEYLMRHAGRVMSRTLITEYAWDYHFDPGTNIVDVVINRLRKKVDSGHAQKLVHTVRGVGYVVKA